MRKVPVCFTLNDIRVALDERLDVFVVLYLAHKEPTDWERSTSRVYMNQVDPRLLYLPVDVAHDDETMLEAVYSLAATTRRILAINQTQPHKSNPVVRRLFHNYPAVPTTIDALIKDEVGALKPYNLNGPAFMAWFTDEVGTVNRKVVVLIGVGGAGESLARTLTMHRLAQLILIDPVDKQSIADELSQPDLIIKYFSKLQTAVGIEDAEIVINAAGKEGVENDAEVAKLLANNHRPGRVFVDLRPQLSLPIVDRARRAGWRAYSGHGMNAQNDYVFLSKVLLLTPIQPPSFADFRQLVAAVS